MYSDDEDHKININQIVSIPGSCSVDGGDNDFKGINPSNHGNAKTYLSSIRDYNKNKNYTNISPKNANKFINFSFRDRDDTESKINHDNRNENEIKDENQTPNDKMNETQIKNGTHIGNETVSNISKSLSKSAGSESDKTLMINIDAILDVNDFKKLNDIERIRNNGGINYSTGHTYGYHSPFKSNSNSPYKSQNNGNKFFPNNYNMNMNDKNYDYKNRNMRYNYPSNTNMSSRNVQNFTPPNLSTKDIYIDDKMNSSTSNISICTDIDKVIHDGNSNKIEIDNYEKDNIDNSIDDLMSHNAIISNMTSHDSISYKKDMKTNNYKNDIKINLFKNDDSISFKNDNNTKITTLKKETNTVDHKIEKNDKSGLLYRDDSLSDMYDITLDTYDAKDAYGTDLQRVEGLSPM